jgi:hypothetical protein
MSRACAFAFRWIAASARRVPSGERVLAEDAGPGEDGG